MPKKILILGAGVIGLCTAYYAALRGHSVTILERGKADHGGCSFGNAGMIVPSHFVPLAAPGMVKMGLKWMWNPRSPFYVKPRLSMDLLTWGLKFNSAATKAHVEKSSPLLRDMNLASRSCYEELAGDLGDDFLLAKRGLLMLCKTQHTLDEESTMAAKANQLGVPAEILDAAGTAKLDPDVTMDIAGAIYFPKDCHLSPSKFMQSLLQRLQKLSVEFVWETDMTSLRGSDGKIDAVQTTTGDFTADEYVLACGSWSGEMLKNLQLNLPMQAGKGYSLTLQKPRELPQICSILTEARVAVTPMGDQLRVGGTMEIAGLNENISPLRVQGIIESVPKYYPKFAAEDFAGIEPWVGLRPCSPDGLPYVGRFARYQNLTAATGHSMMGLSLGPITGKLVSEILSDEKTSIGIGMLSPNRYAS
jgi:D-amino-acid dehydrogenase